MNISIIGLGLIGGSIAAALKKHFKVNVTAHDQNLAALQFAKDQGFIDHYAENIAAADITSEQH